MIGALAVGLGLTGCVSGVLWAATGPGGLLTGLAFGSLATLIQVVSAGVVQPVARGELRVLIRRWAVGLGLRLGGVVMFGIAAWLDPVRFPPVPTAVAYLGVLVPLLFWEIRFLR